VQRVRQGYLPAGVQGEAGAVTDRVTPTIEGALAQQHMMSSVPMSPCTAPEITLVEPFGTHQAGIVA
jgi:hypothetical protein